MYVFTERDIRNIDQRAIEEGFSMFSLMENAGRGIYLEVKKLLTKKDRILILAGRGNNGGDGIVLARYLKQDGYNVSLTFPIGEPKASVAKRHLHFYKQQSYQIDSWNPEENYDVIIDSLLGIGTKLPLTSTLTEILAWCNHKKALKIAIDLPTGVLSNTGETKQAFQTNYTFCIHGIKPSAFHLPACEYYGHIKVIDIGIKQTSQIQLITKERVQKTFPKRKRAGHKGTFGTSIIIAGSDNMPGSALLSAIGAIRTGTGKLTLATSKLAAKIIATRVPEATFLFNKQGERTIDLLPDQARAIAIGPGIDPLDAKPMLKRLLKINIPLVVDAGALLPLEQWKCPNRKAPIILTPHPGEFSRLTGESIQRIQANRIEMAKNFATYHAVTVVLKGENTVIAYPNGEVLINRTGNNALAKGGSGDVLTGMITSMLTTHDHWKDAVTNAVYLHGLCADEWIKTHSSSSMVASDFDHLLPKILWNIEKG